MAAGKRNIFLSDDFYQKDIFTNNFVLSKNINNNWTEDTVAAGRQNIFSSDDRPASSPPTLPDHHHDCYWNDAVVDDGCNHPDDVDDDHNNDDGGSFDFTLRYLYPAFIEVPEY